MTLIGVTGATGSLGGRVARELAARGVPLRLVARDASRAPDLPGASVAQASYGDTNALERAFRGVTTLLFVSAAEHPERVAQHRSVAQAAASARVERAAARPSSAPRRMPSSRSPVTTTRPNRH